MLLLDIHHPLTSLAAGKNINGSSHQYDAGSCDSFRLLEPERGYEGRARGT